MSYNWGDLQEELLTIIGTNLETRIDTIRFRSMCKSWRSAVPLSHLQIELPIQIKLPSPISATATITPVTFTRLENDTRTAACLIKLTRSISGNLVITNPFTLGNIRHLINAKTIDVSSLRFVELCRGFQITFTRKTRVGLMVEKAVLVSDCGILLIYGVGKLGFYRFIDKCFIVLGNEGMKYDDIVIFNGLFYVVDNIGTVYWINVNSINIVQFSPPLCGLGQLKRMVVSNGELFVIDSYFEKFVTVEMRVYKLDVEYGTWVNVRSLEDRVFVLGEELCFSVSSKDFPGCNGNCVYFVDKRLGALNVGNKLKRGYPRVIELDDPVTMKTSDCFPSHWKIFSLEMNFPAQMSSTLFMRHI